VTQRVIDHNTGKGALWTRRRRPVRLMYREVQHDELAAIARERQLKGWSRAKKQALITRDIARLKTLSACQSRAAIPGTATTSSAWGAMC
jgi:putative endonuclease